MDEEKNTIQPAPAEAATDDQKAVEIFSEIVQGPHGDFKEEGYVSGSFIDAEGRVLEDVRLLPCEEEAGSYILHANLGDAMALVGLRNKMDERGIKIRRLDAYMPDLETKKVLDNYSD